MELVAQHSGKTKEIKYFPLAHTALLAFWWTTPRSPGP